MRPLRAFLLICLMLTVPLQAIAGKVLLCESFHASSLSASDAGKRNMQAHHMDRHDYANSEDHSHHDFHAVSQDLSHGDHLVLMDEQASSENHSGSCSMCSSCPTGVVAMTMPEYSVTPSDIPSGDVFHFSFYIPEFAPDLPDDPPRV